MGAPCTPNCGFARPSKLVWSPAGACAARDGLSARAQPTRASRASISAPSPSVARPAVTVATLATARDGGQSAVHCRVPCPARARSHTHDRCPKGHADKASKSLSCRAEMKKCFFPFMLWLPLLLLAAASMRMDGEQMHPSTRQAPSAALDRLLSRSRQSPGHLRHDCLLPVTECIDCERG